MAKKIKTFFICLMASLALLVSACNTKSKALPYAELTEEEKARIALDAKDFPTAITLYKSLVESKPADYQNYRFLSAAYAELGGFDILKAVGGTIGSAGQSTSLLDSLSKFLPSDPTDEQIAALKSASEILNTLPVEQRSYEHPEVATASSAAQQLQFYQAAYSVIYINKFAKLTAAGTLDPSKLETMTEEDVNNILGNFEAIAATAGGGAIAASADDLIKQLDSAPGETRRDKLLNYLSTHSN